MNKFEITWSAPEFEHRPKDTGWYWISIIVAVILVAIAIWQRNFLFAIFITMAEVLVIVWGDKEPATYDFKINEKGLTIGKNLFYPHSHITSFSYTDRDHTEWADVVFYLDKRLQQQVKVHFPKNRLKELQGDLTNIVPLVIHEDSFLENLERFLGF